VQPVPAPGAGEREAASGRGSRSPRKMPLTRSAIAPHSRGQAARGMTPEDFIGKWRDSDRKERAASQQHFLDLCDLLEVKKPGDPGIDPKDYDFEKSVKKPGGAPGSADVWKRNCFAWEYKGPRKSLVEAYRQLKDYADALDNPPLLIVSDMREIQIHTNFTNTPANTYLIQTRDLVSPDKRQLLRWAFLDPERLRPAPERKRVTEEAAKQIGRLANNLRRNKLDPRRVAHFLNKIVFCMFAEDIELLPRRIFSEILEHAVTGEVKFEEAIRDLFRAMKDRNGRFGLTRIPWFNGGLFADDDVIELSFPQVVALRDASLLDWKYIEPSIFGTLFESGLDPEKRQEMASLFDVKPNGNGNGRHAQPSLFAREADKGVGIHYTDAEKIMKIVEPAVLRPLRAEWEAVKAEISKLREAKDKAKGDAARTKAEDAIRKAYFDFRTRLANYRVLDPACGSGNFLYLALLHLKDLDRAVETEARAMGLPADNDRVTTDAVKGIEINPYAAELAQLTIWIGEIQWQIKNYGPLKRQPILGRLRQIECRDALLGTGDIEAKWPNADAIIGNPPFLGGKLLLRTLREDYVKRLFELFDGRVPAEADLVCYWFVKAGEQIRRGKASHAGLVATNSIRGGANRRALQVALRGVNKVALRTKSKEAASQGLVIYSAWDDEPWVIDGAAVRVSLICFAAPDRIQRGAAELDGQPVDEIHPDLTPRVGKSGVDLTQAQRLRENVDVAFMGDTKGGAFDVPGELARYWLELPANANGKKNSAVLRPWANGLDITRRWRDYWIVDFGWEMSEGEAALFEAPFAWIAKRVKPERLKNRRETYRKFWWRHVEARPGMHRAIDAFPKYLATPTIAKHRLFVVLDKRVLPDHQLIVITRDDPAIFGLLHSRLHEMWALRLGTSLEDRPRYTPSTTFETFPFPEGLTPNIPAKDYTADPRAIHIAEAAKRLNELREAWLNPPDLVKRVPEVVPGYPDRILPVGEKAEKELKKRTLTNLYNQRPQWLADAHRALDEAVAAAYGWPADLSDDDILARLLELNLARAAQQKA
jgi:hypothetical protein